MKKMLATVAAIPLLIYATLSQPVNAKAYDIDSAFTDSFYVSVDIGDYIIDDFSLVTVQYNNRTISVNVTFTNVYTMNDLMTITGESKEELYSDLLGLWLSDQNGVFWDANSCNLIYDKSYYPKFTENTEDYSWEYNKTYWSPDINNIQVGDYFNFYVCLYDTTENITVNIFGHEYEINTIPPAPVIYEPPIIELSTLPSTTVATTTEEVRTTTFQTKLPPSITPIPYPTTTTSTTMTTTSTTTSSTTTEVTTSSTSTTFTTEPNTTSTSTTTTTTMEALTTATTNTIKKLDSSNKTESDSIIKTLIDVIGAAVLFGLGYIIKK